MRCAQQFVSRVLVPNGTIVDRIEKLAEAIYDDYVAKGKTPHILGTTGKQSLPALQHFTTAFVSRSRAQRGSCVLH